MPVVIINCKLLSGQGGLLIEFLQLKIDRCKKGKIMQILRIELRKTNPYFLLICNFKEMEFGQTKGNFLILYLKNISHLLSI